MYTAPTAPNLLSIYSAPGPYVTAYIDASDAPLADQWEALRAELPVATAPTAALAAVAARVTLPIEDDVAGWGIIAAADGSTVVDTSPEPPKHSLCVVGNLPYVGPMLEWGQRTVPHLAVVVDEAGIEVVTFAPDVENTVTQVSPQPLEAAKQIAALVNDAQARLIVVGGRGDRARDLHDRLLERSPLSTAIDVLDDDETTTADAFADAVVRRAAHHAAVATVDALKEFRFQQSHGAAVEGVESTIAALRDGSVDLLLIHDDPDDNRPAWFGDSPRHLSQDAAEIDGADIGRLVDVLIWSALEQGAAVRIVPTTGDSGPAENVGAIKRGRASQSGHRFNKMVA